MADIFSVLQSAYQNVGTVIPKGTKYVNVDPKSYLGEWQGHYTTGKTYKIDVLSINGFRARVKYQSGNTVNVADVLILSNSFKVGDSKFTLTGAGTAQVKTVFVSPYDGSTTLQTTVAKLQS